MAEAAVDDNTTNRFFCHKCSIEITRVLEDYTCPTCRGGFIEELDSANLSSDDPRDEHSDEELEEFFSFIQNEFGQFLFERAGSRGNQDSRTSDGESVEGDAHGRRYRNGTSYFNLNLRPSVLALIISLISSNRARQSTNSFRNPFGRQEANINPTTQTVEDFYSLLGMEQFRDGNGRYSNTIEHTIQDFIVNLTGVGWGPMGPGGRGNEPVFFLGNPGDYAWGREGLDTIVSQLLNQMDGSGPPPLDKEKIMEIPVAVIDQEQVDSNLQCSVCWDDFKVGETVRELECEHFYHESCIVPWLELHGTCPICRKSLVGDEEEKTPVSSTNNSSRSNLAAMINAVRNRASNIRSTTGTGSSSSSTSSSTSTGTAGGPIPVTAAPSHHTSTSNSTNPSSGRQPPPPSSGDFHMDFEYD
ncbi:hypothetical protein RUM44_005848 [Polyplax serrata]|uniref:RING-type E3 ubiquitin transferase n=1 Tax=Polyplax serrata TaxID=468196 RepID=A0ABR1AZR3_POLSC